MRLRNQRKRSLLVSVQIRDTEFKVIRKQSNLRLSIASTKYIIKYTKRMFNIVWMEKHHLDILKYEFHI